MSLPTLLGPAAGLPRFPTPRTPWNQEAILYVPAAVVWESALLARPLITQDAQIRESGLVTILW